MAGNGNTKKGWSMLNAIQTVRIYEWWNKNKEWAVKTQHIPTINARIKLDTGVPITHAQFTRLFGPSGQLDKNSWTGSWSRKSSPAKANRHRINALEKTVRSLCIQLGHPIPPELGNGDEEIFDEGD